MKGQVTSNIPYARDNDIVVKPLGEELLIYDLKRHKAHSLNKTAAWVWKHADGHTSAEMMRTQLSAELNAPIDIQVVWIALKQLQKEHLLRPASPGAPLLIDRSRRDAVRSLGIAAVLLPAITTIFAPLAAAMASCKPKGSICLANKECCSQVCGPGGKCQ